MRALSIAMLILSSMTGLTHAQGTPQRRQADRRELQQQERQRVEAMYQERAREERTVCALPDGSTHPVNTVQSYEGQTYRCVEVFTPNLGVRPGENQTLTVRMAGWIKVSN